MRSPRDGIVGYRAGRAFEGVQMAKQAIHQLGVHIQGGLRGARQCLLRLGDVAQVLVCLVEKQAAQQLSLARVPFTKGTALAVAGAVLCGRVHGESGKLAFVLGGAVGQRCQDPA